jgi:valyl-tRNA synthetase
VKVTPAHDPDDYECAKRHGLPIHNLFDLKGTQYPAGDGVFVYRIPLLVASE